MKISIENITLDEEEKIIIRCYEINDEILELMNRLKTKSNILIGYISSISPKAYEISFKGSNHMSYTDLPLFSPLLANQLSGISGGSANANIDKYYCIETMNKLVLEFFNCYIKGEGIFIANEFY